MIDSDTSQSPDQDAQEGRDATVSAEKNPTTSDRDRHTGNRGTSDTRPSRLYDDQDYPA